MVAPISEPTENSTRFAIIGAGGIAGAYGLAFEKTEEATLSAVVDINRSAAEKLAYESRSRAFASIDILLSSDVEIDAVIVCTPPSTHESLTIDLLEAGIHVLCEKPLAIHFDEALAMATAADASGRLLTMASKFRYVPDVGAARQIVEAGQIGEVVLFENAFTSHVDMSQRWNSNPAISGGGVLIDNGTHSLDLARFFLGPIAEVQVIEGLRTQNLGVEETVAIYLKSEKGVMGNVDLSWTINKELPAYITLHGSEGSLVLGWQESKWKRTGGDWEVFGSGFDKVAAFRNQIENFSRAIRGEEDLLVTIEDGIASVLGVEAAYASMEDSPWQSIRSSNWQPTSDRLIKATADLIS